VRALAALREAVDTDHVLQELVQTPLMLSIMSLACQGAGGRELAGQKGDSLEERRKQVFGLYVEQMFQRKETTPVVFPKEEVINWLSWLAEKMREHSQSVFLVEGLQSSWVGTKGGRLAYGTVVALSIGLIFGLNSTWSKVGLRSALTDGLITSVVVLLGCWSDSPLKNGFISGSIGALIWWLTHGRTEDQVSAGLIFGSIVGLGVGSLKHITLVETLSWKWNQFWKRTIPGSILGFIVAVIFTVANGRTVFEQLAKDKTLVVIGHFIAGAAFLGLICGLIFGLVSGLFGGFTDNVERTKSSPNEGIRLSGRNSLAAFLVTWSLFGLILASIVGLTREKIVSALNSTLIVGLIVALNRGGSAVIKHYALRLILWLNRYTPFNFIKFLDQCAKLIFLEKIGGGYIFIHRMLLEYFADLPTTEKSDKSKRT
jgi:hypothetical protein